MSPSPTAAARFLCLGLCLAFPLESAHADTFRVGVGPGCTHATIELALAAALANGPASDDILLAVPTLTLGGRVDFQNQQVVIWGGYPACDVGVPSGRTAIHHNGPNEAFWVHGTSTALLSLVRVDVILGPGAGRGLTIGGHGWVVLENATVDEGQAPEGGNVWISGADAHFIMDLGSKLTHGNATTGDGGGLYCELAADVVVESNSKITDNTAFGSGGGIYVDGCPLLIDQYSSGIPGGLGELSRNKAMNGDGGGMAIVGNATVGLIGWPAGGAPLRVSANEATLGDGGGIAYTGSTGGASFGILCAEVSGNSAGGRGGGLDISGLGSFEMTTDPLPCPTGRGDSLLSGNRSGSNGGGIHVGGLGIEAVITRTSIFGNASLSAAPGSAAAVTAGFLRLESCEIFDNDPNGGSGIETARILASSSSASVTVAYSTLVEDTGAASTAVFQNSGAFQIRLLSSIVQAAHTFVSPPTATQVDCVIVRESASLPVSATAVAVVTDPEDLFVLSTPTDFSLLRDSMAEDFCDTAVYVPLTTDIDGQARGYDDIPLNGLGPYDLGADEWRHELLVDGFESGDRTHWSGSVP